MKPESTKVEIKVSNPLPDQTDIVGMFNSVIRYAQTARSNAMLLRDLVGADEGRIELDREGLRLAMSSQVALTDAAIETMLSLVALLRTKAAEMPRADQQAPH